MTKSNALFSTGGPPRYICTYGDETFWARVDLTIWRSARSPGIYGGGVETTTSPTGLLEARFPSSGACCLEGEDTRTVKIDVAGSNPLVCDVAAEVYDELGPPLMEALRDPDAWP